MICLGLQVDTNNFTLSVSSARLCETEQLLEQWFTKRTATKSVYRGQISARLNCVGQSWVFIVRILALFGKLRHNHHHANLTAELQKESGGADSCGSIVAYLWLTLPSGLSRWSVYERCVSCWLWRCVWWSVLPWGFSAFYFWTEPLHPIFGSFDNRCCLEIVGNELDRTFHHCSLWLRSGRNCGEYRTVSESFYEFLFTWGLLLCYPLRVWSLCCTSSRCIELFCGSSVSMGFLQRVQRDRYHWQDVPVPDAMFRFYGTFQHWPFTLSGVSELSRLWQDLKHSQRSAYCAGTFRNLKTQIIAYFLCHYFRLDRTPATRDTVCPYVQFISRTLTPASVRNYLSGVQLLHLFTGVDYPFTKDFVLPFIPAQGSSSYPLSMILSVKVIRVRRIFFVPFCLRFILWLVSPTSILPESANSFDPRRHLTRGDVAVTSHGPLITINCTKTIQIESVVFTFLYLGLQIRRYALFLLICAWFV